MSAKRMILTENSAPASSQGDASGGCAVIMAIRSPWKRQLAIEALIASQTKAAWPLTMMEAVNSDPSLARLLMGRWLEADTEAALAFLTRPPYGGPVNTTRRDPGGLLLVAVHYLAGVNPERAWTLSTQVSGMFTAMCRAQLLAGLCGHDPAAAAAFITTHGHSTTENGGRLSDLPAATARLVVQALVSQPDSALKSEVLLSTMENWASEDFSAAMAWWHQQSPQVRGASLRGLGAALQDLAVRDFPPPKVSPVRLSADDLTALADTAMEHVSPEDRSVFFGHYLSYLSSADPVRALEWVAENLHGEERGEQLGSAVANVTPQGALDVIAAWDRVPHAGWDDDALREFAEKAAQGDPARVLEWARALPGDRSKEVFSTAATVWARSDPAGARRMIESLDDSPASAALAGSVAGAMIPFSQDPRTPLPREDTLQGIQTVWDWTRTLSGSRETAAAEGVFRVWPRVDPAGAAEALASSPDREVRAAGLREVTKYFFASQPDAALNWALQLAPPEQQVVRESVAGSNLLDDPRKKEILSKFGGSGSK